jgi:hypothetical protein
MLNSVSGALVKHFNMKILSQNVCIQHFENIKSGLPNNKFLFYFFFSMLNKCPGDTVLHDPRIKFKLIMNYLRHMNQTKYKLLCVEELLRFS